MNGEIELVASANRGRDPDSIRKPADLEFLTPPGMTTNPFLYSKLPYDGVNDLVPVVNLAQVTEILVANKDLPANNLREILAHAKARPGELSYSSSGAGSAAPSRRCRQ